MASILKDKDEDKDEYIEYSTYQPGTALKIVEKFGYKLNYIEFCAKFRYITHRIWNEYRIITSCGLTMPTALKQPQIYKKVVKPIWLKIFVESELDRILFQLWCESSKAIEKISVDYVIQTYGSSLDYTCFVTLPEVPAEAYNMYRNKQLGIQS
jgi:hypothetical protein